MVNIISYCCDITMSRIQITQTLLTRSGVNLKDDLDFVQFFIKIPLAGHILTYDQVLGLSRASLI